MLDWFRKFKIRYRLIVTFLIVGILPAIIISIYSYQVYSSSLHQKLLTANITSLSLVNKNISAYLDRYQYFMDYLYIHPDVQSTLENSETLSVEEKEAFIVKIRNLTEKDMAYPLHLQNIIILSKDGTILYDSGYEQIDQSDLLISANETFDVSPQDYWSNIENYRGTRKIIYGRKVNNINNTNMHTGYIFLVINEALFTKEILINQRADHNSDILLLDYKGRILSSNDKNFERGASFQEDLLENYIFSNKSGDFEYVSNDIKYIATFLPNKDTKGYSIALMPHSYIKGELNRLLFDVFLMLLVLILISLIISSIIYTSISKPIRNIVASCKKIQDGDFNMRIHDSGADELRFLSDNIDNMLVDLQNSMEKQKNDAEKTRLAEIQMLQYQINPHFLFNTLSTFRWFAIIHKLPMLDKMSFSLSEILKNTLIDTNSHILLCEELNNLSHYITIQSIRYAEKFQCEINTTDSAKKAIVPKFILQPLVENCIEHGTYDSGKIIKIEVIAYIEMNQLIIKIIDNGKGFEPSSLIFKEKKDTHHIGIANIQKRLEYIYGNLSEFILTSELEIGTQYIIKIPLTYTVN